MSSSISFILDNQITTLDFKKKDSLPPTTTLLKYLRQLPNHKGTKEGCAIGDCGACTVVLAGLSKSGDLIYKAVNSCLVLLPMVDGLQIITVENLKSADGALHMVQQAMVELNGSQCGFCTPGIVMSLFALSKNLKNPSTPEIKEFLSGNLCRCTGYQSILEAGRRICSQYQADQFDESSEEIKKLLRRIKPDSLSFESHTQKYWRPLSISEALHLKNKYPAACFINGCTDAALTITRDHGTIEEIIDLSNIEAMKNIRSTASKIVIGAGTSLQDIKLFSKNILSALYEMLSFFGSLQIRNLATLAGNLANASPISDSAPLLMAYNARVKLRSTAGTRTVKVCDFIRGYHTTQIGANEIISEIEIPHPEPRAQYRFYKFSKRSDLDIATVSAGFMIRLTPTGVVEEIILAFGGMAEMTRRAENVENYLLGKAWSRAAVTESMPLLEECFTPISDARGSARGRMLAARNLILKFWQDTSGEFNDG